MVGQRQDAVLGRLVGLGVGRERIGRKGFVADEARILESMDAAGRRQEVALDAGRLGELGAADP